MSKPLTADGPFPPLAPGQARAGVARPEPEPVQALGATALLDAWKLRASALTEPPGPPTSGGSPVPNRAGAPDTSTPAPAQARSRPGRLAAFAAWPVVIAAALGLGAWLLLHAPAPSLPGTGTPDAARPAPVQLAAGQLVLCPLEPVVPVAGEQDGKLPMQADVSGLIAVDIDSFVILGREALAAGRERDAEVALLMSCRIADTLKGAASVESADAKYRLGAHYAGLRLREGTPAGLDRAGLLARAEILYADSLLTYSARFGDDHEKSRLAAERLAGVRRALAQRTPPAPAAVFVPPGPTGTGGAEKLPGPSLPGMAAKPAAMPLPAFQAREKIRPAPPVVKECPPAVEALGLCDRAS